MKSLDRLLLNMMTMQLDKVKLKDRMELWYHLQEVQQEWCVWGRC